MVRVSAPHCKFRNTLSSAPCQKGLLLLVSLVGAKEAWCSNMRVAFEGWLDEMLDLLGRPQASTLAGPSSGAALSHEVMAHAMLETP